MRINRTNQQAGFTLVEIIVSTAIFIIVVSALLTMFNDTLRINRRVQALREVVQGTRTFTETITREVRNGRIDYNPDWTTKCNASDYLDPNNQSLALIARNGDRLCFYLDNNNDGNPYNDAFYLKKKTAVGIYTEPVFGSTRFTINSSTFHFYVNPKIDPNPDPVNSGEGLNPGIQPFVTIVAQFQLNPTAGPGGTVPTAEINYQTTISTDVYDIPRTNP